MDNEVKVIGRKIIALADLHHQYVKPIYQEEFWHDDMSVPNSPHVEIMRIFMKYGFDVNRLKASRYVADKRKRFVLGRKAWTDDYIFNKHLKKRWKVFRLVKKGFTGWIRPIMILTEPFWKTRFGNTPEWVKGPELWDGHGRASAMYVMGYYKTEVDVCEDAKPGSGQWKKVQKEL